MRTATTPTKTFTSQEFSERILIARNALAEAMTVLARRAPGSRTSLKFTEKAIRIQRELDEVMEQIHKLGY